MTVTAAAPKAGAKVVSVVCSAHFFSHFFQLGLPPLFPILKDVYGVGYTELGLLVGALFLVSSVAQVATGFVVDRFGARLALILGTGLLSGSFLLLPFFPTYEAAFVLMLIAGLGNSVFHPADFAIFQAAVRKDFLGRAYSLHSFSGNFGWAAAPPILGGLAALVSWQAAFIVTGLAGLAVTAALFVFREDLVDDTRTVAKAEPGNLGVSRADIQLLVSPPILACFFFFLLFAITIIAFNTFAVTVFTTSYGLSLVSASSIQTTFMIGFMAGILPGGYLADKVERHDRWTAAAFLVSGAAIFTVGIVDLAPVAAAAVLAVGAFTFGGVMPCRDMIVRKATPAGSTGKVFGFVYAALDLGGALAPVAFGWLLTIDRARWIFLAVAIVLVGAGASAILARSLAGRALARAA